MIFFIHAETGGGGEGGGEVICTEVCTHAEIMVESKCCSALGLRHTKARLY